MKSKHTITHTFTSCYMAQKSNHKQTFDSSHEQYSKYGTSTSIRASLERTSLGTGGFCSSPSECLKRIKKTVNVKESRGMINMPSVTSSLYDCMLLEYEL